MMLYFWSERNAKHCLPKETVLERHQ